MQALNCIVVDDEPLARNILEKFIGRVPGLILRSSCKSVFEALEVLRSEKVDLIFLDINMPGLTGLDLVKTLDNPPAIIFVTAFPEHAVEGFDLDALDYLLKPVRFERFLKAVNKAFLKNSQSSDPSDLEVITIRADKKLFPVNVTDIQFIRAYGDYLRIYCTDKNLVTHETIKNMEEKLPKNTFARIHKSYIVNIYHIKYIEGNMVAIANEKLPLGRSFKEEVLRKIKRD